MRLTTPSGFALEGLYESDPLYIVQDNRGVASLLAQKLLEHGIRSQIVQALPSDAHSILYLRGINSFSTHDTEKEAISFNEQFFNETKKCAAHLFKHKGLFMTVQDTGGDFGLSSGQLGELEGRRFWSGGIAALAKTAALEWPQVSVKAIDLQCQGRSVEELADLLCFELLNGGGELEVGLKANGDRFCLKTELENLSGDEKNPLSKGSVVVVSGGARGVTAHCLIALAKKIPLKIVILGRTALQQEADSLKKCQTDAELKKCILDQHTKLGNKISLLELKNQVQAILANREVNDTLQQIEQTGSQVKYFALDICDLKALSGVLNQVREEWGAVSSIVHAAGVLADKYMHEKTPQQFHKVFDTKVLGFQNLLLATENDPLTHICCFSSVAARFGNPGQVDYSMGNEVLNKVCQKEQRERGEKVLVKSLNWGPWAGGMVSPELQTHFAAKGISLIPIEEGAKIFVEEMENVDRQVEVVIGGDLENWVIGKKTKSFAIHLDQHSYSFINSHRIQDVPVVPMMMVNEWFLRAASMLYPNQRVASCQKMRFFKGLLLANFEDKGDLFYLHCEELERAHSIRFFLTTAEGRKCYEMSIELAPLDAPIEKLSSVMPIALEAWAGDREEIYRHRSLFHGEELQVIQSLEGVAKEGCCGILTQSKELSGISQRWSSPLAILDGGLQLALLWVWEQCKGYSLPTGFDHLVLYRPITLHEPVRCEVRCGFVNSSCVKADIFFINQQEEMVACLQGLDLVLTTKSTL